MTEQDVLGKLDSIENDLTRLGPPLMDVDWLLRFARLLLWSHGELLAFAQREHSGGRMFKKESGCQDCQMIHSAKAVRMGSGSL